MPRKLRKLALTIPQEGELVERASPGEAPSAFRIWAAGPNVCDDETVYFTEKSAQLLMDEQTARGRLYSFDFDHLSIQTDRPAESGRAAGWHSLAVRKDAEGKSELWAVGIQWCGDVKAGLEAQPPLWRYFSPAFFTDADGQVTSYINCAVCVNPLTHQLPSLANIRAAAQTGVKSMDKKALLAALATLASNDSTEDQKKEAAAALAAHFDAEDGEEKKDDEQEEKSSESDEQKDEEEKKEEAKAATVSLAKENQKLKARMDAFETKESIAARPDLSPAVAKWLSTQPLATVKSFLSETPKGSERPNKITQGKGKDDEAGKDEKFADLGAAMGMRRKSAGPVGIGAPVAGIRRLNIDTAAKKEA